jgi:hypothetical protein
MEVMAANHAFRSSLIALAATLGVVACDVIHGISRRSAEFTPMPAADCILEALRSVPGMRNVSYRLESGDRPDRVHRYFYDYEHLRNNLYLLQKRDGAVALHHSLGCLRCTPPQKDIDLIYPLMLKVEEALETRCNISNLRDNITQSCSGVRCGGA